MESKTLREKCLYPECFWPISFLIRTEYEKIRNISPYSVWIQENTDQKNSEYGHFLRNESHQGLIKIKIKKKAWLCKIEDYIKKSFLNWRCIALREECPYTGLFLVRIFPHSDWIFQSEYWLSLIVGKYGPEITLYLDTFRAGLASATFCKHHRILTGKILSF